MERCWREGKIKPSKALPMKANINQDEMKLLAYLHEHATGYIEECALDPAKIKEALGIDDAELGKDMSYLKGHGLVGVRIITFRNAKGSVSEMQGMWLTSTGEDYMRELENQPGIGKKITVAAVKQTWEQMKSIAAQVLAELIGRQIQ
jgi:hypothetical protein